MRSSPSGSQLMSPLAAGENQKTREIPELLRLLGAGASDSILLALGDGPLRTKDLITRVPGYAPRTIYRYVSRLVEVGAVWREADPGVPSKVVHHLTEPCGTELCDLVGSYATTALEALPGGGFVPQGWGSLTLLADLWETGMYEELTLGPCTATELAGLKHDLSFHQVNRRTTLFLVGGLIREANDGSKRRRYELTQEARQAMAVVVGLGRWRERYVAADGEPGLTSAETAEVLRAALPLAALPNHAGKTLELTVLPQDHETEKDGSTVWAEVGADGTVATRAEADGDAGGWVRGKAGDLIQALLDGDQGDIQLGGSDPPLAKAAVWEVQGALWRRRDRGPDGATGPAASGPAAA